MARAEVLLGCRSEYLDDFGERDGAIRSAPGRIEAAPDLGSPERTLHTVIVVRMEFWQANKGRPQNPLRYECPDRRSVWKRHMLWS
ncbi:hypothetical protein [Streptomyces sp. NPDC051014]|uniref:hypothetical protein n=1 Tax=Streptomyces sp. NPDC051014 TaxID=3155751 RepID=UPI0033CC2E16